MKITIAEMLLQTQKFSSGKAAHTRHYVSSEMLRFQSACTKCLPTAFSISVQMPTAKDSFYGQPVCNWVVPYAEACLRKALGTNSWHYTCISNDREREREIQTDRDHPVGVKKGLKYTKLQTHMIHVRVTLLH